MKKAVNISSSYFWCNNYEVEPIKYFLQMDYRENTNRISVIGIVTIHMCGTQWEVDLVTVVINNCCSLSLIVNCMINIG